MLGEDTKQATAATPQWPRPSCHSKQTRRARQLRSQQSRVLWHGESPVLLSCSQSRLPHAALYITRSHHWSICTKPGMGAGWARPLLPLRLFHFPGYIRARSYSARGHENIHAFESGPSSASEIFFAAARPGQSWQTWPSRTLYHTRKCRIHGRNC
jgi:hypothetical protein